LERLWYGNISPWNSFFHHHFFFADGNFKRFLLWRGEVDDELLVLNHFFCLEWLCQADLFIGEVINRVFHADFFIANEFLAVFSPDKKSFHPRINEA